MNEYIKLIENARKKAIRPLCKCMYPSCDKEPIKSHTFQKNGMLRKIAEKGKVMSFDYKSLYLLLNNEIPIGYKERGCQENFFWFYGFCSNHDTKVFQPIEKPEEDVDWKNVKNQYLLAYRTICRELYIDFQVKEILYNLCQYYTDEIFIELSNINCSIQEIIKYKRLFEEGIFNNNYSKYYFKIVELPFKLELCLASPIIISEELKGFCFNTEQKQLEQINIVEVFPYKNHTMIILGFLKESPNKWMNKIYENLHSDNINDICISLQDFLFRSEYHCISKKLYYEIKDELPQFFQEWCRLKRMYNAQLEYKSNIFRKPVMKLLGYSNEDIMQ